MAEQSTVVPRVSEYGGVYYQGQTMAVGGGGVTPPSWVQRGSTIRFLLALASARIPGESQFLTLSTDAAVVVELEDAAVSAVPELCFVLPSGDVLDLVEYVPGIQTDPPLQTGIRAIPLPLSLCVCV